MVVLSSRGMERCSAGEWAKSVDDNEHTCTPLSLRSSEDVMVFVNEVAHHVHSAVVASGGTPNKNVGDAFLSIWKMHGRFRGVTPPPDLTHEASVTGLGAAAVGATPRRASMAGFRHLREMIVRRRAGECVFWCVLVWLMLFDCWLLPVVVGARSLFVPQSGSRTHTHTLMLTHSLTHSLTHRFRAMTDG